MCVEEWLWARPLYYFTQSVGNEVCFSECPNKNWYKDQKTSQFWCYIDISVVKVNNFLIAILQIDIFMFTLALLTFSPLLCSWPQLLTVDFNDSVSSYNTRTHTFPCLNDLNVTPAALLEKISSLPTGFLIHAFWCTVCNSLPISTNCFSYSLLPHNNIQDCNIYLVWQKCYIGWSFEPLD